MSAAAVIAAARSYCGTPFHHQGRRPGVGLDCAGVVVCAFRGAGYKVADRRAYSRQPDPHMMRAALAETFIARSQRERWADGDVLYMRFAGEPQHLAIVAGGNVIHSYYRVGAVVEHRLDAVWRRRVVTAYRHPGLADE